MTKKKNIEFIDQNLEQDEIRITSLKDVIDGSLLTRKAVLRQLPYVLFLTFLAVFYIGNRYHAEKVARKAVEMKKEVKELRARSITTSSELMQISKQSQVARMVGAEGLDLEELEKPPRKLRKNK